MQRRPPAGRSLRLVIAAGLVALGAGELPDADAPGVPPAELRVSSWHCVGENPVPDPRGRSFIHASCLYRNLCMNTTTQEFVAFTGPAADVADRPPAVAVGAVNVRWTWKETGISRMRFQPAALAEAVPAGALWPADVPALREYAAAAGAESHTWLLWHSMGGHNFGHMMLDDVLPLWHLASLFGLGDGGGALLPLRFVFPPEERALWASCDFGDTQQCERLLAKWLVGLGTSAAGLPPPTTRRVAEASGAPPFAGGDLVCFPRVAVGIGALSDHCGKAHGWTRSDFAHESVCNAGRGGAVYAFRRTMLHHLALSSPAPPGAVQRRIVFSVRSSREPARYLDFAEGIERTAEAFAPEGWAVQSVVASRMDAQSQALLAATSTVWVSACGGGAATALFLPRGATLVLYYADSKKEKGVGAYLDWDFFAHLSHVRVHWLHVHSPVADLLRLLHSETKKVDAFVNFGERVGDRGTS